MLQQQRRHFYRLIVAVLIGSLVLLSIGSAEARGRSRHGGHHGRSHLGLNFNFHYPFGYFHYPYYQPYYRYSYAPYFHSGDAYSSGERRRFPAFRLPGFFHYPGALGKGEKLTLPASPTPAKTPSAQ